MALALENKPDSSKDLNHQQLKELKFEMFKLNDQLAPLLYTSDEKQFYRRIFVTMKIEYGCYDDSCQSKVILKNQKCFRNINEFIPHNHQPNEKMRHTMEAIHKMEAMSINWSLADSNGILKPLREIYDEIMIE